MFLTPPIFLGGGECPPELLDQIYLIEPVSDHVAKSQGNRSRELGGNLAKEKKTSRAFYKSSRTTVTVGLTRDRNRDGRGGRGQ